MRFFLVLMAAAGLSGAMAHAALIDLRQPPYSAAADGTKDDRPALAAAFSAAKSGDTVFVPAGDYRIVLTKGRLSMPEGVSLLGENGRSRFLLVSEGGEKEHREFLQPGSGSVLQGMTFVKDGKYPSVLFPLFGERSGIVLRDCVFEGGAEKFPGAYSHCFQVGNGALKDTLMERIVVRDFTFGLFQANPATGSVVGFRVEQSLFEKNASSDLEFNSPNGTMTDVTVRDSVFRDNRSKNASGGFAVGFANVQRGIVENCRIESYGAEALHVEDRSEDILLKGNTIVGGSKIQGNGVILVVNDSRKVTIEANYIDGRQNENKTHLILVTAGGKKFPNPSGVVVKDNVMVNGGETVTWYLQDGCGPEPIGNVVVKPEEK